MRPYYQNATTELYLGSCVEVLAALPNLSAAVTITSPPYWNAREYDGIKFPSYDAYLDEMRATLAALRPVTDWLVWIAGYIWRSKRMYDCSGDAARIAESLGFMRRQQVPWVKTDYAPQPSIDLAPAHELIQVLCTDKLAWSDFDCLRVSARSAIQLERTAKERPHGGSQQSGGFGTTRIDGKKQPPNIIIGQRLHGADYTGHPAAFPLEIVTPWVAALAPEGAIVLDPYAGSGTTLVAAESLGRKSVGIEVSERYCEMIAKRLDDLYNR